jgi:bacillithiol system protein YtxJ
VAQIVELSAKSLPSDCYLFKHSTRCPISASAAGVVRAHPFDLPVYWVNVVEQRDLSNWIAATYSVPHESPQLLEIRGGVVKKSLSHYEISAKNI